MTAHIVSPVSATKLLTQPNFCVQVILYFIVKINNKELFPLTSNKNLKRSKVAT